MTTYPTTPLEAIGADGAFEIGGGDFNFGQNYTENLIKNMVRVPMPTNGNAVQILQDQLKKLPLEALQYFKHIIPGTVDDDFIDIATSVATITGNLANLPRALLTGDFDEWVSTTYNVVSTEVKQILEILGGLVVTPINEAVQAVKDWYQQQKTDLETALENSAQELRDQLTGIVNSTPTDVDNWLLGLLTGDSIIPKENISGFNEALNAAVAQAQQKIRDSLTGVVNATPTQLDNWILNLLTSNSTLNASKLSGTAPSAVIPSLGIGKLPDLQSLVDAATNALSGKTSAGQEESGVGLPDAKTTMTNLFNMLTKVTRDVQALQSEQDSSQTGGRRFNVDFSNYPDGAFPSGLFNITYTGAGTSTLGIKDGHAVWNTVNNGYRRATMIYPTPTLTPQQIVRGTLASPPSQGTNVRIWSIARANAAGTDYVFARGYCTGFLTYRGDIGCVVNGVEKIWASNVPLTWSLDMRVICGVGNNPRRHQVLSGNSIVVDLIEPADKQSVIDDNHCYWGAISETDGQRVPGTVAGASVSDNAPPSVVGTTFRAYRATTTGVNKPDGAQVFGANTFDAVEYIGPGMVWSAATNTLTVPKAGTYMFSIRVLTGGVLGVVPPESWELLLFKGGSIKMRGETFTAMTPNVSFTPAFENQKSIGGSPFLLYLNAGESVQFGMASNGAESIVGDVGGTQTWVSAVLVG
ncbi:minor tail protein [Mycobacterium phage Piro94]|uniref:Minor tail subunit n=1 Tax=Mycobacterium phage Piro94 TaxID=1527520 RepID=A0A076YHJ8_9CAUD|nr:minor tail protein [Mycobacterium phage Piro94]AIK67748.1 minor tail subunit [Mycobacterium phage Piro94]